MPWHALSLADLEFMEFRQALERAYRCEIAAVGSRGYTLYRLPLSPSPGLAPHRGQISGAARENRPFKTRWRQSGHRTVLTM